jgi:hypothetical protein
VWVDVEFAVGGERLIEELAGMVAVVGLVAGEKHVRVVMLGAGGPGPGGHVLAAPAPSDGVYGTFSGSFPYDAPFPAPGPFATFHGAVTCLKVSGDNATIGGVLTSGYGYDDTYTHGHRDLTGDWFITTVQDPAATGSPNTMGYIDWGDRSYFANQGFKSFVSLCDNPAADLGTAQFPLSSGDIKISD